MAQAGPVPHLPEDGKVVTFRPNSPTVRDVATGSRLPVDVEFGPRHRLYALSQGVFPPGNPEGSPALPNTGALVKANRDGSFSVVIDRLKGLPRVELTPCLRGRGPCWKDQQHADPIPTRVPP